jgi:transcriptional regulator with XRE-family HTH domain
MIESKCVRCGWIGVTLFTCPDCSTPESRAEAALAASLATSMLGSPALSATLVSYNNHRAVLEWIESDVWMDLTSHVRFNVSSVDADLFHANLIRVAAGLGVTHERACRVLCRVLRDALETQGRSPELEPVLEVGEAMDSQPGWTQHTDSRFGEDGIGMWRRWGRDTYVCRCGDGSGGWAWGIFDNPHGGCSKGVWETAQEAMSAAELREAGPIVATSYVKITGAVLRSLRKTKGLTQSQVASHVGLKHSAWSRIERGQVPVTVEQTARACERLKLTPGEFFKACSEIVKECLRQGLVVSPSRLAKTDERYVLFSDEEVQVVVDVTLDLRQRS